MQPTTTSRVSSAQRARSILAVSQDLHLAIPGVPATVLERHVVLPGGALLVAAPEGVRTGAPVVVEVVDVSSVPQPDRVRGHLRLEGTITPYDGPAAQGLVDHLRGVDPDAPAPVLARIVPTAVALSGVEVDVDEFGRAAPEPFVAQEHRWLPHLQQGHPGAVRALAERAVGHLDDDTRVCALGLDRFGVTLRLYAGSRAAGFDVRCDFAAEVGCGCDVREAITAVLHA